MIAPARGTVAVDGRPAGYLEVGRGTPLVLVHGAAGSAAVWRRQLEGLADVARVLAVDLPGHGPAGGRGCQGIPAYADWLVRLFDVLGLDRVVLGGHSMGGAVAQTVALGHPARLTGLVLVGTGARLRVLPRVIELFRAGALAEAAPLVASLSYSPETAPGTVVEAERALLETPPAVTLGDFLACDRFDLMAELGGVQAPTLVVVGRDDRLTPPKYARLLAGAIPGARLVELPGAGHFPQLEQPIATNAALRAFLTGLAP